MRGRLHHTFQIEFAMLSAIGTRSDPDAAGPLTSGYDDDFGEILVFTTPAGEREEARRDEESVFLPCNVETDSWEALQQMMAGNSPDSKVQFVAHRRALERMRLVNAETGETLIRVNDRVLSIRDRCRSVVYKFREPLYVVQAAPTFGIGAAPDLVIFTCEDRESFVRS